MNGWGKGSIEGTRHWGLGTGGRQKTGGTRHWALGTRHEEEDRKAGMQRMPTSPRRKPRTGGAKTRSGDARARRRLPMSNCSKLNAAKLKQSNPARARSAWSGPVGGKGDWLQECPSFLPLPQKVVGGGLRQRGPSQLLSPLDDCWDGPFKRELDICRCHERSKCLHKFLLQLCRSGRLRVCEHHPK